MITVFDLFCVICQVGMLIVTAFLMFGVYLCCERALRETD